MKAFAVYRRALLPILLVLALLLTPCATASAQATNEIEGDTATVTVPIEEQGFLQLLLQVKELADRAHPSDVSTKTLYEGMLRGLLESLEDPHSSYLTEAEFKSLATALDNTYSGVGIVLKKVGNDLTVVSTIKGAPAERAGVKPGDVVVSVDDKEYIAPGDVSDALRGPAGTSVVLVVRRPSTGEILTFSLCREEIVPPSAEAVDLGDDLYYLDIDQFDRSVGRSFAEEIAKVKANGAKGLLLDLRDNPGGLLDVGVEVAQHLVPRGVIVELQGSIGTQVIAGTADTVPIPVVVLVNERTASASEIVAGAIRDHGVGILVGEQTYGKGSIQQVIPLGQGLGAIRLTVASYFTPSGTSISGTGLAPDIEVDGNVSLPGKLVFKRPLKTRIVGLDVLALQESLSFLGYYGGEMDGVFGPGTETAVRSFLADQKSSYTGSVDAAEIEAINAAVLAKAANAPDNVYLRGLEALRHRVQTGTWPTGQ